MITNNENMILQSASFLIINFDKYNCR